jgi:hypothetical protein
MRTPAVILLCFIVGGLTGAAGYYVADRSRAREIARLTEERDFGAVRERELRGQLEEALTARATLAQEAQRLQADLAERLKRLETIADQLASEEKLRQEGRGE